MLLSRVLVLAVVGSSCGGDDSSTTLPPDFHYLNYRFGGPEPSRPFKYIHVNAQGDLQFQDGAAPQRDARLSSGDQQSLARILNAPGALDELVGDRPCSTQPGDIRETLDVDARGKSRYTKDITGCSGVYSEVRKFMLALPERYFRWDPGSCPAPNIWRYMSAGCGAEARPVCGTAAGDGCAAARCSCDGRDIVGCDFTSEPYAHEGFCTRDGGAER
jgi:hypothetical protein